MPKKLLKNLNSTQLKKFARDLNSAFEEYFVETERIIVFSKSLVNNKQEFT